jgi:hypothetical protein
MDANALPTAYARRAASGTSGSKREAEPGAQCSREATVRLAGYEMMKGISDSPQACEWEKEDSNGKLEL